MTRSQSAIPATREFDSTLALLREGYLFVGRRCEDLHNDLFRTRLMLSPVVCMRGPSAAGQFYREGRFTRQGALPPTTLTLLQDRGSVQTLDGDEHRHRKQMFMDLMDSGSLDRAVTIFRDEWNTAAESWVGSRIVLHDEVRAILTRTALRWCGIPLDEVQPEQRTAEFSAMIEGAGSIGPYYLRARLLRARSERWAQGAVQAIREGRLPVARGCPAERLALHRDLSGELLNAKIAAVELINLLRPMVAIARFIIFAAHALHENRGEAERLGKEPASDALTAFVQEVRRFYPFFPLIGGRVREPFTWRRHRFAPGDWVVLDLYGTDHHPETWHEPETFRSQRFRDWKGNAYSFIPQGGGGFMKEHRCPGEWLTIALTAEAVRRLLAMDYEVPDQDLSIPMNRLPTRPKSGFMMDVRPH
ncbi:cytochrome P450 [Chelativorans sp. YIM 93263]|uniref:cytochrome P450 n=1 Tax=Chelativorans sp. YIM 93263 TaxID=2906648 RepID=UPI0023792518|nr:cytochrome P450 [Chelativorans sp. YIM 93263]